MWKIIGIVALVLVVAVGGTMGYLYSSKSSDLSNTKTTLATTQSTLASTQNDLATTKSTLTSTQNTLKSTQDTLASTQTDLKTTQDDLAAKTSELASTKSTLSSTQTELTSTKSSLTTKTTQLTAIQSLYPLKHFPTVTALRNWLATQPITTFSFQNTSALQDAAMNDGWLISAQISWNQTAQIFQGSNTAILDNGELYIFYCDDHTLTDEGSIY
jgi:hypothetical protein